MIVYEVLCYPAYLYIGTLWSWSISLFASTEDGSQEISAATLKGESEKLTDFIVHINFTSKLHNFSLASLWFWM